MSRVAAASAQNVIGDEGEAELRRLAEQEMEGFTLVSADGTMAYVHPNLARRFGYDPEDVIGQPLLMFIAESERASAAQRLLVSGDKPPAMFASTLQCKDGSVVDVVIHSAGAMIEGQKALIRMVLDIGKHKRTEERIHEGEGKFRSLAEQNVAGIAIIRDDRTIGYCNAYFANLIGCEPAEIVGRPLLDFVPEDQQPIVAQNLRSQLFEAGAPVQIATTVRAGDGSIVEVLVNASKSTFEGGPASLAVVVDVTDATRPSANWRPRRRSSPRCRNRRPTEYWLSVSRAGSCRPTDALANFLVSPPKRFWDERRSPWWRSPCLRSSIKRRFSAGCST
jgi:two-component system, sensor histidine kinase and response regulator